MDTRRSGTLLFAIASMLGVSATARANTRDDAKESKEDESTEVRLRHRPQLALGVDLGFDRYAAAQAGGDFGFGPAWQVRVGAQLHPVISIDAHYFGTRHEGVVGSMVAHGFSFEPRVSIPLRIRPYLSTGFGWYTVTAYRNGEAIAEAPLALQVPVSLGAEWLLRSRIGLQAEGTCRILLDQGSVDGAYFARTQLWGGSLGARAYF